MEYSKPFIFFSFINPNPALLINGSNITCNSSIGPYKTVFGDYPLLPNGLYYWEFQILKGAYFKIGIAEFPLTKTENQGAFCDKENGYGLFSIGQLRHFSNLKGPLYGEGFGVGDIIGVLYDGYKGNLSFFINGKDLGIAFKGIKKGAVYYPAVACLLKEESIRLKLPLRED